MSKKGNPKNFIREHPIIFKKYKPLKLMATGSTSNIYLGYNVVNQKYAAIKTELITLNKSFLESESYILFILKGYGIPTLLSYGRSKKHKILVQTLLGKSLLDIYNERKSRFTLNDVCLIAIQALDRIKWVHSKNYIHRDIKPSNFLIGKEDPDVLYLIDFGLSKKYKSDKTGKHISLGCNKKIIGTVRYLSINALRGKESSRRDDIISIGYMLIIFLVGNLPWGGELNKNTKKEYIKMIYKREKITPEELCFGLPEQFVDFIKYSYNLKFEEKPNYDYLRSLFITLVEKKYFSYNNYIFSWINKNGSRKQSRRSANREYNNKKLGRSISSSRQRLLIKIRSTLQSLDILNPKEKLKTISLRKDNSPENLKKKITYNLCSPEETKKNFKLIDINQNGINNGIEMSTRPITFENYTKNKTNNLGNLNSFRLITEINDGNILIQNHGKNLSPSITGVYRSEFKGGSNSMNGVIIKKYKKIVVKTKKTREKIDNKFLTENNNISSDKKKKNISNNINYTKINNSKNINNRNSSNNIANTRYNNKFKINYVNNYILKNNKLAKEFKKKKNMSISIPNSIFCQMRQNTVYNFTDIGYKVVI